MIHRPSPSRYRQMEYRRTGVSGLKLPVISMGLWHNFGQVDDFDESRKMIRKAFDAGITHFDLANNYGPPPGSAEENFGKILRKDFAGYRDEMIISTKAGYGMWPGPYGDHGSRKYLLASLDQSLRRLQLDYVDIFYSHRPDPGTPMEETMQALDHAVRSGKALYAGISNYDPRQTKKASGILRSLGTPCLIHQARYSMLNRRAEKGLTSVLKEQGIGMVAFSPLAQGLLTDKYLHGIPENSRAGKIHGYLQKKQVTPDIIQTVRKLNELALSRDQSLARMAIAWLLARPGLTSVLVGASNTGQLKDNLQAPDNIEFSERETEQIENILRSASF